MLFLEKARIKITDLKKQIREYLVGAYGSRGNLFSPASPYGQILEVVENLQHLNLFYIEDSINEMNIETATKQRSIYGLARLTGHNPTRIISASGEISIKFVPGANTDMNSTYIRLQNFSKIKNVENGLMYTIFLESNESIISTSSNDIYTFRVVQGEIEDQTVRSRGTPLQSFNFTSGKSIEQNHVTVFVNGEAYEQEASLYDMNKDQKACMVKTGIGDGIDVIFGNEDNGFIPAPGALIRVEYLTSQGTSGNIGYKSSGITFKLVDEVITDNGESVDLNEYVKIGMEKPIILGSESENPELTKLILGSNSRSLILARDDNYEHFLSRYGLFSYVNAYTTFDDDYIDDDNVVYLFIVPDVMRYLDKNSDYFTTNVANFALSGDEKDKVYQVLEESKRQMLTAKVEIINPIIKKYGLNIYLGIFDDVKNVAGLRAKIYDKISEYMLNVRRRDKIPRSDLIAILEGVDGIDSVSISFISEENETAIRNGFYFTTDYTIDRVRQIRTPITRKVTLSDGDNPNLGLDEFGDIILAQNELPVIRGGWTDRNNVTYEDGVDDSVISSVNIMIKGRVGNDMNAKLRNQAKESIRSK